MAAARTSRAWVWVAASVVVAFAIAGVLGGLYVRGGGPLPERLGSLRPAETDVLTASSPEEQVLRTLRLVGVDRAVAGEADGVAVVRVELPEARSAGDVSTGWQAALGSSIAAYPDADRYVVQLFGPGAIPLAELAWNGSDARATSDPAELRSRARLRLLAEGER